jgi:Glycosyltransferase family 87
MSQAPDRPPRALHVLPALGVERVGVAALGSLLVAAAVLSAARGAGPAWVVALLGTLALAAVVPVARRLPTVWDGALRRAPVRCVLWALLTLAGVWLWARLGVFMADAGRADGSVFPFDRFYVKHSCLSAYVHAAELAGLRVDNLYDESLYEGMIGPFAQDEYLYPPTFLLLPRLALAASGDFLKIRAVWYGVSAGILVLGVVAVAAWIGGDAGRRAGLLAVALALTPPVLMTLQIGNFQIAAVALACVAVAVIESRRDTAATAAAAAVLAFVSMAKVFPGVLVLVLVARRRWRAVGWVAGFALVYVAMTLALFGTRPFVAFFGYRLPHLASFNAPDVSVPFVVKLVAINHAVAFIPFKLQALGVPGMSRGLALALSWVYTAGVLAATVAVGRAPAETRLGEAARWLALLHLAALRSPFVPDAYALITPLWLLTLVAAEERGGAARRGVLAACALLLCVVAPLGKGLPEPGLTLRLVVGLASQAVAIGLCLRALGARPVAQWIELRASRHSIANA